jgi:sulfite reductase (NADPH) flavoprotein alpha-component
LWVRGLHTGEALGFAGQTIAGLASLGGCFLVWTGFAMAWRRFRYRNRAIDAALTGAPIRQVAPMSEVADGSTGINVLPFAATPSDGVRSAVMLGRGRLTRTTESPTRDAAAPVLILYGTVTGNAETVAKSLAARLRSAGIAARVRDMADCQPGVLKELEYALIVISTYGDGKPPDDAAHFYETVTQNNGLELSGLRFSVLALGNTTYDQFCRCGKDLDAALVRHGATRLYPRVDCDAEYELPARRWIEGVLASL